MTFDSARGRTVLYGGSGAGIGSDVWEWDGTSWTLVPTPGPPARADSAMAYDSTRGKIVLFGGGPTTLADTWEGGIP